MSNEWRRVLPSIRHLSVALRCVRGGGKGLHKALETRRKGTGPERLKHAAERIRTGDAALHIEKRREKRLLFGAKHVQFVPPFGATNDAQRGDDNDRKQRMFLCPCDTRVFERREKREKSLGSWNFGRRHGLRHRVCRGGMQGVPRPRTFSRDEARIAARKMRQPWVQNGRTLLASGYVDFLVVGGRYAVDGISIYRVDAPSSSCPRSRFAPSA